MNGGVGTTLEELELPEEPVLELLNHVSIAKRMANMVLSQEGFGSKQENNRKKTGGNVENGKGRNGETGKAAGKGGAVGVGSGKGRKKSGGKVKKVGGD